MQGLKYGYTQNNNDEIKAKHYKFIQTLAHEFQNQNGSIICKELLGLDGEDNPVPSKRTQQYYKERPCEEFVANACKILDKYICDKNKD